MNAPPLTDRAQLRGARRVVVKVGSSSLTGTDGRLDVTALRALVDVIAAVRADSTEVVLVSSGAIAAGLTPLGLSQRPADLATAQATASVGQGLLVARYTEAFARHDVAVGQVLLTAEDVIRRGHYLNAQRTLARLLGLGVVPVVNENDTVATDELRFGDNDRLAALVSHIVGADALLLLTDVDGLYDAPPSRPGARRIPRVSRLADVANVEVTGRGSTVGTGGMVTKLDSVAIATRSGIPVLVTCAAHAAAGLAGDDVGTWFDAVGPRRSTRQLWLAYAARTRGRLVLDDGAVEAICERRSSLLPIGIRGVHGAFSAGDPVELADERGNVVARGLTAFSDEEYQRILALPDHSSAGIAAELGEVPREAVHADVLVVLTARGRRQGGEA